MITFLAACIDGAGTDSYLKATVTAAITTGSVTGALLRKGKPYPETTKQFDDNQSQHIQHNHRQDGEYSGKIDPDKLDYGGKQETAHQATE